MSWNLWAWSSSFLSAPGLAWQAALKKTKVKLEISTDMEKLLVGENGSRGGICHAIHRYAKPTTDTWKIMIKIRNSVNNSVCSIGMLIIYTDGQCHKSCL